VVEYSRFDDIGHTMTIYKAYSASESSENRIRKLEGGLAIDYYFPKINLGITLEIVLRNDSLVFRFPDDSIIEEGEFGIVRVELMPFFGASDSTEDGYIFYPDGPGALMEYDKAMYRPVSVTNYVLNVYSPETAVADVHEDTEKEPEYVASLPVWGIKNSSNAVLAIAVEGEGNSTVNISPEGYLLGLNRVSFKFSYRSFIETIMSDIQIRGAGVAKNPKGYKIVKRRTRYEPEVKFVFLEGEDADYSGMANTYRDHLISEGLLHDAIDDEGGMPVSVDYFMGTKEKRLFFNRFISMTTFEQAEHITRELMDKGVEDIQIEITGWAKGGYGEFPINWPPERKIGGTKGLKEFSAFAADNDMSMFLRTNFVNAKRSVRRLFGHRDLVLSSNLVTLTDEDKNWYLLNPVSAFDVFISFLSSMVKNGIRGIGLDVIGRYVYQDYNKKNPVGVNETIDTWKDIMSESGAEAQLAVEGGNSYVFAYADRLYDVSIDTSRFYIEDKAVPFFQMVVHGMIPYSSDPGNYFYDPERQKLKWIEYGCMPHYQLTFEKTSRLERPEEHKLLNTYYVNWIDNAAGIYKEFNERLADVWGELMVEHDSLLEDLYFIRYSNGTEVYINYSDDEIIYDGNIIKAMDYLVVDRSGGVK